MLVRLAWLCASVAIVSLAAAADEPASPSTPVASGVVVSCDPRIELVGIVYRLAGRAEYSVPAEGSALRTAADIHFAPFAGHAAVLLARRLSAERGIGFDAPMSLAVHWAGIDGAELIVPLEPWPERIDRRFDTASARELLAALVGFARDTGFAAWWEEQAGARANLEGSIGADFAAIDLPWFGRFFGRDPVGATRIIISPAAGNHAFGLAIAREGGFQLTPVVGIPRDALSTEERAMHVSTLVHELCHPWVNPAVDRAAALLDPPGEALFPLVEVAMRAQAYATWRTVLHESIVRAATIRYARAHPGVGRDAEALLADDAGRGFGLVEWLDGQFALYEGRRDRHPDLDAFLPEIAAGIERIAANERDVVAPTRPRVVSITPPSGSRDLASGPIALRIAFDRPMAGGYSLTNHGEFPRVGGQVAWSDDRTTLTIPLELAPGREYRFGLNGPKARGFRAEGGAPLAPVLVELATAPEAAGAPPSVVSIAPAQGARDVAPGPGEIRIEFDRPMGDGYSLTGGGPTFPPLAGKGKWSADRTVFTIAIDLAPGRDYAFGVNSQSHRDFRSAEGIPAEPVRVEFRTRE